MMANLVHQHVTDDRAQFLVVLGPVVQDRPAVQPDHVRQPGDVVVEAFGCDPPETFVARMAAAARAPVWVNLEYLSAEDYVERSHRLRSPQRCGLDKWFFYPGFTPATGGLLREDGLLAEQARFDATAWLAEQGIAPRPGERLVSLFCYPQDRIPALLDALGELYGVDKTTTEVLEHKVPAGLPRWVSGRPVLGLRPDFQLCPRPAGGYDFS